MANVSLSLILEKSKLPGLAFLLVSHPSLCYRLIASRWYCAPKDHARSKASFGGAFPGEIFPNNWERCSLFFSALPTHPTTLGALFSPNCSCPVLLRWGMWSARVSACRGSSHHSSVTLTTQLSVNLDFASPPSPGAFPSQGAGGDGARWFSPPCMVLPE